jgi:RNA recognition motif-containing protein
MGSSSVWGEGGMWQPSHHDTTEHEDMVMNIFVGNLAFTTTDQELRTCFEAYGTVQTVRIMTDRDTGRPRGFGFVEMPNGSEAQAAIAGLNGTSLGGRPLTVNEARQREERGGPRRPRW